MKRKTIPDGEWNVTLTFYDGALQGSPLVQRTIRVVDSQRHNVGALVQGLVDESFDALPNRLKRVARHEKKGHA